MSYTGVLCELIYDEETQETIDRFDDELKNIFEKFKNMFVDMDHHQWSDDSEIYGGITYKEFKRIYMILLSLIRDDIDNNAFQTPLPRNYGDNIWEIYKDDNNHWNKKKTSFNASHISKYHDVNQTAFLTESEANRICLLNNRIKKMRCKNDKRDNV